MLHSLPENLIGPNGAVALARNLQYCPVLEKLWCVHPRSMRDPTRPCAIILPTHAWPMPCATSRSPTVHDSRPTLARPLAVPQCLSSPRVSVSRLHDNRIGDAGALAIAAALKDCPLLKQLWCAPAPTRPQAVAEPHRRCGCTGPGPGRQGLPRAARPTVRPRVCLSPPLSSSRPNTEGNAATECCRLARNLISDDGARALAAAVKDAPYLQQLTYVPINACSTLPRRLTGLDGGIYVSRLDNNQITDVGAEALLDALHDRPLMTELTYVRPLVMGQHALGPGP